MPEPKSRGYGHSSKEPQHPGRTSVPEHLDAVTDMIKRSNADIESVGQQAESGDESQQEGQRLIPPAGDLPEYQREQTAQDRPAPNHPQRVWILPQVSAGNCQWMEHDPLHLYAELAPSA